MATKKKQSELQVYRVRLHRDLLRQWRLRCAEMVKAGASPIPINTISDAVNAAMAYGLQTSAIDPAKVVSDELLKSFNERTAIKCAETARDMAKALGFDAKVVRTADGHLAIEVLNEGKMMMPMEHFIPGKRTDDEHQKAMLREFIPSRHKAI